VPKTDKPKPQKRRTERIKLAELVLHPTLQMRALPNGLVDPEHVAGMVRSLERRKKLPPPKVRRVPGLGNLVTDGFHGVTARITHNAMGSCDCEVLDGEWIDAVEDAVGSESHPDAPLKHTREDKRKAVLTLLEELDKAGKSWGKARIAEACRVSDTFVAKLAKDRDPAGTGPKLIERKDGSTQKAPARKTPEQEAATAPTGAVKAPPFNWQVAQAEMGLVQRMPDALKRRLPEVEQATEFAAYVRLLGELAEGFEKLKKAAQKQKEKG
jgi:hypothetical protein